MFTRVTFTLSFTEEFVEDPSPLSIDEMPVAIGFYSSGGIADPIYNNLHFKLSAEQYQINMGHQVRIPLEIGNCTADELSKITPNVDFFMMGQNYYCIRSGQGLKSNMYGKLGSSPTYAGMEIAVTPCVDAGCLPIAEVQAKLGLINVAIVYSKSSLSSSNFDSPLNQNQSVIMAYGNIGYSRIFRLDITPIKVVSDVGLVGSSYVTDSGYSIEKTANLYNLNNNSNGAIFAALFQLSDKIRTYTRTYQKLQDVLGQITGMSGILSLIAMMFFSGYFEIKAQEKTINYISPQEPINITVGDFLKSRLGNKKSKEKLLQVRERIKNLNERMDVARVTKNMFTCEKMVAFTESYQEKESPLEDVLSFETVRSKYVKRKIHQVSPDFSFKITPDLSDAESRDDSTKSYRQSSDEKKKLI